MRNMSFALTTEQVLAGQKTVTRRLGWKTLKDGELFQAIEKGQGLKKGEKVNRLRVLKAVDVRQMPLNRMLQDEAWGKAECIREGFPNLTPREFVEMFCKANRPCEPTWIVTRIEFDYPEVPHA